MQDKITIEEFRATIEERLDRLEALYRRTLLEKEVRDNVCQEESTSEL